MDFYLASFLKTIFLYRRHLYQKLPIKRNPLCVFINKKIFSFFYEYYFMGSKGAYIYN